MYIQIHTYIYIHVYIYIYICIYIYIILCRAGAKLLQTFWANKSPRNNFTVPSKKIGHVIFGTLFFGQEGRVTCAYHELDYTDHVQVSLFTKLGTLFLCECQVRNGYRRAGPQDDTSPVLCLCSRSLSLSLSLYFFHTYVYTYIYI